MAKGSLAYGGIVATSDVIYIDASANQGIGTVTPTALLEVEQSSGGGVAAFKVDNNDTDEIAISVEAANINSDVIQVYADALTTSQGFNISADALTTGSALYIDSDSSSTGTRNIAAIIQNHSSASGSTTLYLQNDHATANALKVVGAVQVGIDNVGHNVVFYGATAGSNLTWNQSDDSLRLTDSTQLRIGDSADLLLYHDGSHSYIQHEGTGGLYIATGTSGKAVTIGHTTSEVTVADNLTVTGTLTGTLATAAQGTVTSLGTLTGLTVNGAAVFNENSADVDFRVESNGQANMLYVDAGNDRVGIGTATPAYPLHVKLATNTYGIVGESTDGGEKVGFYFGGSNDAGIGTITNTSCDFFVNSSTKMTLTNAGYLGIGTTSPGNLLHLHSTGTPILEMKTTGTVDREWQLQVVHGDGRFSIRDETASANRFGILIDGKVGIGVDAPASLLHVAGTVQVGVDGTGHDVRFYGDTSGQDILWDASEKALHLLDNTELKIGSHADGDMRIYHQGTNSYIDNRTGSLNIATATSGIAVTIGHTTSETTIADNLTITGTLTGTNATFSVADNSDTLTLTCTDSNAASGPNLRLYRLSGSPADSDIFGQIDFEGRNDNSQDFVGAMIKTIAGDVSDGTEDTQIEFDVMTAGTLREYMRLASGGSPIVMFNADSQDIDFQVQSDNYTHALFVQGSDGFVGIGDSTPAARFSVKQTSDGVSLGAIYVEASGSTNKVFKLYSEGSEEAYMEMSKGGVVKNIIRAGGITYFNGGNVGIGTTTAAEALNLSHGGRIKFNHHGGASGARSFAMGNGWSGPNANDNYWALAMSDDDNATIDTLCLTIGNAGFVGIGTASPDSPLRVECTNTGGWALHAHNHSTANNAYGALIDAGQNHSSGYMCIMRRQNLADIFRFRADGDGQKTNAGDWSGTSDERLKENITSLNTSDCLTIVNAMKPKKFKWINTDLHEGVNKDDDGFCYGFIAQDFMEHDILKMWASSNVGKYPGEPETADHELVETASRAGNDEDTIHTVSIGGDKTFYVGAIQELLKKNTALETRIAALENA